jgi:sulfur-oxidizing protein SoxY
MPSALMRWLAVCVSWLCLGMAGISYAAMTSSDGPESSDPLNSPMWSYTKKMFLGDASYRFDDRVRVTVPAFAEDPTQVPLQVDVSALDEPIKTMIVWADLNPIQHIYTLHANEGKIPTVSLRFKVQQGTAVRAAVQTQAGEWLVGGQYLDASGGGCTAPSVAAGNAYWESHLGEMQFKRFERSEVDRLKMRVIHPMDTGLVDAIPEFYIEQLVLSRQTPQSESVVLSMELSQPVSENPVIQWDVATGQGVQHDYRLWMRDNNGNEFEQPL